MIFRLPKPAKKYTRNDLISLIDRLKANDQTVLGECIAFALESSEGVWHGRARAKIYRTLKHRPLDEVQRDVLVDAVINRLESGYFAEQFKDQLRAAIIFNSKRMQDVAESLTSHKKDYVRRYASWTLNAIEQRQ